MSKTEMKRILMKKLLFLALLFAGTMPISAQEPEDGDMDYKPFPHMFVGVQGGAQTTFTNYDQLKLITPTASVYFGGWFTSVIGARLHVNGIWNKGGYDDADQDFRYNYKYVNPNLDLMLNMCTLFGKKDVYPINFYLLGGIGINYSWDNDEAYAQKAVLTKAWKNHRINHNARVGFQVDVPLAKHWGMNLEVAANSISDRYNSKVGGKDDWSLTAQLGLSYRFGFKKNKKSEGSEDEYDDYDEIWETRVDTIWYDDVTFKEVTADREIKKEIFFGLKEDGVSQDQAQITAVAEFLKGVKDGEITITSYADKGTGTPQSNMKYSKQRAENTKKALIEKGVDPNMIKSVEWKGDTVQPYPDDNDKNRLSVITGHGIYTDKEKVVTKKFRTKEVRYLVE